ncbi:DUF3990 domain-containing protein [Clostridium taeniosporum]|uniref:DUF3990 domain-containing protein n=1 Tax=Clostridium taeniosporum TaxID=394958 RepID=A0A1D7XK63_9CLOT|nr:DUF3990 domain-containing protein [Clostridium taeniosporum]AOR23735.1 DUF3990 domain-containing protein [Clostridium taeniosporum]
MIVYHGSEKKIERPINKGSRKGTDFGSGFYCTKSLLMAKSWCALRNGQYVNKYDLDLTNLKVKEYNLDLEWLIFVCYNRSNIDISIENQDYDVIIGPTADDKLYRTVQNFLDNVYSVDETLNILNCMKIDKQINLVSKKALKNLKFLGVVELTLKEIFNIKENEMLNLSTLNNKVFKARRTSNKDVYYIDLQEK